MKCKKTVCTIIVTLLLISQLSISFAIISPSTPNSTLESKKIQEIIDRANSKPVQGYFKSNNSLLTDIQPNAVGSWSWADGIICITDSTYFLGLNHGHAGLIAIAPYYAATVEAGPANGVEIVYGDWPTRFPNKQVWQVGVARTTVYQDHLAAAWACDQIGKPYGFPISLGNREKFYCSQLVYAAYLETCNVNLDTIAWVAWISPWEILDNSQVILIYRKN